MPVLTFGPTTANCLSRTEVGPVALARTLCRGLQTSGSLKVNVSLIGRLRGPIELLSTRMTGDGIADLKRMLRFAPIQGAALLRTLVQYFLDATATPAPVGKLLVPSIDQITNPNATARGFNGLRFVKGNSVAIEFTIRGQRLQGFNAQFTACRVDEPIGSPHDIVKNAPGSIRQTDAIRNTANGIETITGVMTIDPPDTASLPDGEIEFIFEFKVDDGNGRVHTLDSGKFKVYSIC